MNKKWILGLISAGAFVAGLVACGSGDLVEVDDIERVNLAGADQVISNEKDNAMKDFDACVKAGDCKDVESTGNTGSDSPASSSSSKNNSSKDDDSSSASPSSSSKAKSSSSAKGGSDDDDDDVGSDDGKSSSSAKGGSDDDDDAESSSSVKSEDKSSSSSKKDEEPSSSSKKEEEPSSSSKKEEGGAGGGDISLGSSQTLEGGTYTLTDCNGSKGSKNLQLGGGSSDDCLEWFGVSGWGMGPWGTCSGQISVSLPLEITVPAGASVQVGNCW